MAAVTTRYRNKSFNPRLPGGRRLSRAARAQSPLRFQSTPSGGKATCRGCTSPAASPRFNPRLPGGRRRDGFSVIRYEVEVSIHAFRGEGDPSSFPLARVQRRFQSTPSGGKATDRVSERDAAAGAVSIHAFRGEGDRNAVTKSSGLNVSIHAFRGEGDRNI